MDHLFERRGRTKEPAASEDINKNIDFWVKQKNELTQVPQENVFDAAEELDAGTETEAE
ncbi:hypothetical protein AB6A23_15465 [Paenibacillus tarimensis]